MSSILTPTREFLTRRAPELRQTLRVTIATLAAYVAYRFLGLQQGYWAVFTVMIVMQGSIGGTLGAATERMIGTLAGAVFGGLAAAFHSNTSLGIGIALVLVTCATVWGAAIRPQLRVAPVTAAIMLLTEPAGAPVEQFVLDRIIEIGLGGLIGVLAMVLIFPARSHTVVVTRSVAVLIRIQRLLLSEADALERGEALVPSTEHPALRQALSAVEQALKDADRERASRLADHRIPPAIPRTLWRVRNDLVAIGGVLREPLPAQIAPTLAPAAARLLRAEAELTQRCATALDAVTVVSRNDVAAAYLAFTETFSGLRQSGVMRALDFNAVGRAFGLAFTLDGLHRDLTDLADRIDEIATGIPERTENS
ncbi:hypothetical protein BH10PSE11_BH10PSE11_12170 [soil metagenome]